MASLLNSIRNLSLGSTTLGQALSNLSSALYQISQTHIIHPQMKPLIEEFLRTPELTFQEIPAIWQADAGIIELYAVSLRSRNQLIGRTNPESSRFGGNPIVTTSTMLLEWSLYQLLYRIGSPRVSDIQLNYGQRFSNLVQPLSQVMTPSQDSEQEMDRLTPDSPDSPESQVSQPDPTEGTPEPPIKKID